MTTDTDEIETTEPDATAEEVTKANARDREPSDAYGMSRNVEEIHGIYQSLWEDAAEEAGGRYRVTSKRATELQEDLRRALVRCTMTRSERSAGAPRVVIPVARPTEHDDGTMTITCVGACATELPVNKFATLKTGGRSSECRACAAARKAAAR